MKMPRPSVWLTALLAIYATVFFAYKFFVEHVGATTRNISAAVAAYVLVALVWFVNRRSESRRSEDKSDARRP